MSAEEINLDLNLDNKDVLAFVELLKKYELKNMGDLEQLYHIATNSCQSTESQKYVESYSRLRAFVEQSAPAYQAELSLVLYPILVQIYFKMISSESIEKARAFLKNNQSQLDGHHLTNLASLQHLFRPEDAAKSDYVSAMQTDKFGIRMCKDAYGLIMAHLQDPDQQLLADIAAKSLHFDVYEGMPRNKEQCLATSGSHIGEAKKQDNKKRVLFGVEKEPDLAAMLEEKNAAHMATTSAGGGNKRKSIKVSKSRKLEQDANVPPPGRIPLPALKDVDHLRQIQRLEDSGRQISLGRKQLPTALFYTIMNSNNGLTSAEISEDASMLACGLADGSVCIWSLTADKLLALKEAGELQRLHSAPEAMRACMLDESSGQKKRLLLGHKGPVYRVSFSPCQHLLVSCSEDCHIRLWSLQTWTCLVIYRGHVYPVWDVRFSPKGFYFVSCSYDKTARLWATNSHKSLRFFVGHLSDVDCVEFHPNTNYIATGSGDRTVRLWDVATAKSVRIMTGHKSSVMSLAFSNCGRFLASGSIDKNVIVWDVATGILVTTLVSHTHTVVALAFSRDNTMLATGGLGCRLALWDFKQIVLDYVSKMPNLCRDNNNIVGTKYLVNSYPSKETPFVTLRFSRQNLLLCVGYFKT
ncbi:transcription initiation factor TFIID subunit 5-like [Scaptodrosophila lebanonensis]|uniref:Transcription initiation factor TFIID subunit 5 n=1 Tax=Drosophila lebanonensis TaxID=7225 RepID=A0A6J2U5G2_DROLE|nr:transcription initiation factor TFIID subunit 5-like [Scaptodrosophila lebanonensis]